MVSVEVQNGKDYDNNDQVDDVFLTTFESGHETLKAPQWLKVMVWLWAQCGNCEKLLSRILFLQKFREIKVVYLV